MFKSKTLFLWAKMIPFHRSKKEEKRGLPTLANLKKERRFLRYYMNPSTFVSSGSTIGILDQLAKLKQAIWRSRPVLADIMQKRGAKNLYDYALDFLDVKRPPALDDRKRELFGVTQSLLSDRLGPDVAQKVVNQLSALPLISTTDHHGIIQHPFFLNANIISALPYAEHKEHSLRYLVVFSFSSISLNNASGYPRGLLFHGGINGSDNLIKLPILPDKEKMGTVYASRAFTKEDLARADADLEKKRIAGDVTAIKAAQMRRVLNDVFSRDDILACKSLNEQCTKLTYELWPRFFHAQNSKDPVPDLVYLEIETLVTELLLRHHFVQKESLIHRLLFTPAFHEHILKHFDGIPGAFSNKNEGWGSFLFWGLDEKGRRVRLLLQNGYLCTKDGVQFCEYNADSLAGALRAKRIYPSMMLSYLMISLYYGMKCLGGFCQVHDLTLMKEAWCKVLNELELAEEVERIASVQTKELSGDGMVLAYMQTPDGHAVPATGFDLLIEGNDTSFSKYKELARRVTLEEIMQPMFPEMYTVLYSQNQRDESLLNLKPEQIYWETGLASKLGR